MDRSEYKTIGFANEVTCIEKSDIDKRRIHHIIQFVFYYFIPLFIIAICYTLVANSLWRRVSFSCTRAEAKSITGQRTTKSRVRITKLVFVIITVFILCWTPSYVFRLCEDFQLIKGPIVPLLRTIVSCLAFAHSAFNPIIYAFMSHVFRRHFLRSCFCACCNIDNPNYM